jgi:hypothetical protein
MMNNIAFSIKSRLLRPLRKLFNGRRKPVIRLKPGETPGRALGRMGKYSTVLVRNTNRTLVVFLAFSILVAACTPGANGSLPDTGATAQPGAGTAAPDLPAGELPEGTPQAVTEALAFLSQELGITVEEITVQAFEQVDWSNACLELPEQGEVCAEVITPGFRVRLEANGEQFVVHTDELGTVVRIE